MIIALAGSVLSVLSLTALPAQAYTYGHVYVAYPTWLGSCPGGGTVDKIWAANGNIWSVNGDYSDDLIYPKVALYNSQVNIISAQPRCHRPWWKGGSYMGVPSQVRIYPTRNNQTFWVGPLGQSHN